MGLYKHSIFGQKYGALTCLGKIIKSKKYLWKCDCGNLTKACRSVVVSSNFSSCGCLMGKWNIKHGAYKSEEYSTWQRIKSRVGKGKSYRNVTLVPEWYDFLTFLKDMGKKPEGRFSIDRIDPLKGYCKENCRWADIQTQNRNRTCVRKFNFPFGVYNIPEASEISGVPQNKIAQRLRKGFSPAEAVSEIKLKRRKIKP